MKHPHGEMVRRSAENSTVDAQPLKSLTDTLTHCSETARGRHVGHQIKFQAEALKFTGVQDAQAAFNGAFKPLIADLELERISTHDDASPQVFAQMIDVDGQKLRVFGAETKIYYNDDTLTAFSCDGYSPSLLTASGSVTQTDIDEGKRLLGTSIGRSVSASQVGVFVPTKEVSVAAWRGGGTMRVEDPSSARVAVRFALSLGTDAAPIHVYWDPAAKAVLSID